MATPPVPDEQLRQAAQALSTFPTKAAAAEALGLPIGTFNNRIRRAAERGFVEFTAQPPDGFAVRSVSLQCDAQGQVKSKSVKLAKEAGERLEIPAGQAVRGVSVLTDEEGREVARWTKTSREEAGQLEALRAAFAAMSETIERVPSLPAPSTLDSSLTTAYIVTDFHLGLLAWGEETGGEDWDIQKAEQTFQGFFELAVNRAPNSKNAVIAINGDQFHWDGMDAVTPTSRHLLDADTRFPKLVRVGIRSIRRAIDLALLKHEQVSVYWVTGNHDISSSIMMREWLAILYELEPRVWIDTTPSLYHCHEAGQVALFFHHGHKRNMTNVAETWVAKFREIYGRTTHHYGHLGHLHHKEVRAKESGLMVIEQHQTLAPSDAHAAQGGYISKRAAQVITYDHALGEVGRLTISPEMIKRAA
ncbi:metallophosphoesterase [Polycladidibacter hongkongensis]|uniref:metallophosphoesterase n=1 Tax=Polycladidibacter hongkongensis TaxID=1647556 RepID=UPI00082FC3B3|nr:metallophosphoesterase [Pseudovibrio hongkongensis]